MKKGSWYASLAVLTFGCFLIQLKTGYLVNAFTGILLIVSALIVVVAWDCR